MPRAPAGPVERRIGKPDRGTSAEDDLTLQLGIGGIPDAVLERLGSKHDLGVHTEMFSDGIIPLIEGVVTNRLKEVHRSRSVASFVGGTQRLYDFVHDNLLLEFHPCDRTNDPGIIRRNPRWSPSTPRSRSTSPARFAPTPSAHRIYSGIGGQMDFMRGAALSEGQAHHRPAFHRGRRQGVAHRLDAQAGCGRRDHAGARALGGHRARRGELARGAPCASAPRRSILIAHPDFRAGASPRAGEIRHFVVGG